MPLKRMLILITNVFIYLFKLWLKVKNKNFKIKGEA